MIRGMTIYARYPREWLDRVSAVVFGCLLRGELRINVYPNLGLADGAAPWDVSVNDIPFELRLPNTRLWLQLDENFKIMRAWLRESGE